MYVLLVLYIRKKVFVMRCFPHITPKISCCHFLDATINFPFTCHMILKWVFGCIPFYDTLPMHCDHHLPLQVSTTYVDSFYFLLIFSIKLNLEVVCYKVRDIYILLEPSWAVAGAGGAGQRGAGDIILPKTIPAQDSSRQEPNWTVCHHVIIATSTWK